MTETRASGEHKQKINSDKEQQRYRTPTLSFFGDHKGLEAYNILLKKLTSYSAIAATLAGTRIPHPRQQQIYIAST